MQYKVFSTAEFDKLFNRLDAQTKHRINKVLLDLKSNPYNSKQLSYKFFREKKIGVYRIYFLVYDDLLIVFVISLSDKKSQQKTIDAIKKLIPKYKDEISRLA